MAHIKKHHKVVDQINSPLGNFPQATSARVLFSNANMSSVQGNSDGQVSSPKVISAATFICGKCGKECATQEEIDKHMVEENDDEELLNAVKEAEDLYNALQILTQKEFEPEKEKDTKEELKDKLGRFWDILTRKSDLQKQTSVKIRQLEAEVQGLKNDVTLGEEVEANQRIELDEKEDENKTLSKQVKSLNNVIKQKDLEIKELLEMEDEVVEVPKTVTMNKESAGHHCNACEKTFRKTQDLDKHMDAKHNEKQCSYCDTVCDNETELIKHHIECIDTGVKYVSCKKCDQKFTNLSMRRHKEVCKGKLEFDCPECGVIYSSSVLVKKHYDNEHKFNQVESREVCFHWRRGNCTRMNCRFAHVGHQASRSSPSARSSNTRVPACKNGISCEWLKKGNCSYFHTRVGVQRPWVTKEKDQGRGQEDQNRQGVQARQGGRAHKEDGAGQGAGGRRPCKFDGRCERIPNCPYIHSLQDFPLLNRQGQKAKQNTKQRRQ